MPRFTRLYCFKVHSFRKVSTHRPSWNEFARYGNRYGVDLSRYIGKMDEGHLIPSSKVVKEMSNVYGQERVRTIHPATCHSLAAERLMSRNTPALDDWIRFSL